MGAMVLRALILGFAVVLWALPGLAQTGLAEVGGPVLGGPVLGRRHMVAAANPMAAAAGLRVLREGGSAVDAAIAVQMVLGVVEPQSSGMGGGSLMLTWDAGRRVLAGFEGLAAAPAVVSQAWGVGADGAPIAASVLERSGRAVGVPGTLRMLGMVHRRYGRLAWSGLFREAIGLAEGGFPLPPYLHSVLLERPGLAKVAGIGALYFGADGAPLAVGTVVRNPALGRTLRLIAARGADWFYRGAMARDVAEAAGRGAYGSAMTAGDLARYRAKERAPVCLEVFAHRVCSAAPPAAGGVAVLQQLALLERLGIGGVEPGSAVGVHLFLEAGRLTAADRRSWLGDPDFVAVPVRGLLDAGYLAGRAGLVSREGAMAGVAAGEPGERRGALPEAEALALPATTDVAVVDDWGNAVSFTTTINLNFGADRLVDGFVLNDGLSNFAVRGVVDGKAVANGLAAGKRPVTTMAPTMVFGADGRPVLVVGAGGGARIIDAVAETILGVVAWHKDVRAAVEMARYGAQNRAEELEVGTAAAGLVAELQRVGDHPVVRRMNAAVQAVARVPGGGLAGWGDGHRDGVALGD